MSKRFRKAARYTRISRYSRPVRRDVISLKQLREWLQSNITFTLVNEMTVTKDANKDYTRVAWTSPNTSGVISPLMALNDDPLFKRLLSASD